MSAETIKLNRTEESAEPGYIDGMAPEKNLKVHKLAKKFYDITREAKACKKALDEARDTLLWTMAQEGLSAYHYGDILVDVNDKKSVKAKFTAAKVSKPKKPKKAKSAPAYEQ